MTSFLNTENIARSVDGVEYHPLIPFLPENAKVLFLGSFPPQRKRWCMDFYYPNFINDHWRIDGQIFFGDKNHFVDVKAKRFKIDEIVVFCKERVLRSLIPLPLFVVCRTTLRISSLRWSSRLISVRCSLSCPIVGLSLLRARRQPRPSVPRCRSQRFLRSIALSPSQSCLMTMVSRSCFIACLPLHVPIRCLSIRRWRRTGVVLISFWNYDGLSR